MATAFATGLGAATAISFVLGLLVGLLGGSAPSDPEEEVSVQVDGLFAALQGGSFSDTWRQNTSIQFRESVPLNNYVELGEVILERFGNLKSKTSKEFQTAPRPGGGMEVLAVYDGQFDKGPGVIRASFRKVDKKWLLMGFMVQPPEAKTAQP